VKTWCGRHALRVDGVVTEVGSGMSVRRLTLARLLRGPEVGTMLDRDLNAARNLATLVGEVTGATPSCGATVNQPDGNPRQTMWAAGTATGKPTRPTPRRKATATRTQRTHIRPRFIR
jgi:putative transposase